MKFPDFYDLIDQSIFLVFKDLPIYLEKQLLILKVPTKTSGQKLKSLQFSFLTGSRIELAGRCETLPALLLCSP